MRQVTSRLVALAFTVRVLGLPIAHAAAEDARHSDQTLSVAVEESFKAESTATGCDYERFAKRLEERLGRLAQGKPIGSQLRPVIEAGVGHEVDAILQSSANADVGVPLHNDRLRGLFRFSLNTSHLDAAEREAICAAALRGFNKLPADRISDKVWQRWLEIVGRFCSEDHERTNAVLVAKMLDPVMAAARTKQDILLVATVLSTRDQPLFDKYERLGSEHAKQAEANRSATLRIALKRIAGFNEFGSEEIRQALFTGVLADDEYSARLWRAFGGTFPQLKVPTATAMAIIQLQMDQSQWAEAALGSKALLKSVQTSETKAVSGKLWEKYATAWDRVLAGAKVGEAAVDPKFAELYQELRGAASDADPIPGKLVSRMKTLLSEIQGEDDQAKRHLQILDLMNRVAWVGGKSFAPTDLLLEALGRSSDQQVLGVAWAVGDRYFAAVDDPARAPLFRSELTLRTARAGDWPVLAERLAKTAKVDVPAALREAIEQGMERAETVAPPAEPAVLFYLQFRERLDLRNRWATYLAGEGQKLLAQANFTAALNRQDLNAAIDAASVLRQTDPVDTATLEKRLLTALAASPEFMDPFGTRGGAEAGAIMKRLVTFGAALSETCYKRLVEVSGGKALADIRAADRWVECCEASGLVRREFVCQSYLNAAPDDAARLDRLRSLTKRWPTDGAGLTSHWKAQVKAMLAAQAWDPLRADLSDRVLGPLVQPLVMDELRARLPDASALVPAAAAARSLFPTPQIDGYLAVRDMTRAALADGLSHPPKNADDLWFAAVLDEANQWGVDEGLRTRATYRLVEMTPLDAPALGGRVDVLLSRSPVPSEQSKPILVRVLRVLVGRNERTRAIQWRDAGQKVSAFGETDAEVLKTVRGWEIQQAKELLLLRQTSLVGRWKGALQVQEADAATAVTFDFVADGPDPLLSNISGTLEFTGQRVKVTKVSLFRKTGEVKILLAEPARLSSSLPPRSQWSGTLRVLDDRSTSLEVILDIGPNEPRCSFTLSKG